MKTLLFLGQAPARPSSKHEIPGTYLHAWLHSIGFSDSEIQQHCHFYALTDIFPGKSKTGGHQPPSKEHIALHRPILVDVIRNLQPDIIVPVGKLAITELTGQRGIQLTELIGKTLFLDPFDTLRRPIACIPLSHPSGISAWNHAHKDHVQKALAALKNAAH